MKFTYLLYLVSGQFLHVSDIHLLVSSFQLVSSPIYFPVQRKWILAVLVVSWIVLNRLIENEDGDNQGTLAFVRLGTKFHNMEPIPISLLTFSVCASGKSLDCYITNTSSSFFFSDGSTDVSVANQYLVPTLAPLFSRIYLRQYSLLVRPFPGVRLSA